MTTLGNSSYGEGAEGHSGCTKLTRLQMPEAGTITAIENYIATFAASADYYAVIYRGSDTAPGALAYSGLVTAATANAVSSHTLSSPISASNGEFIWVGMTSANAGSSYTAVSGARAYTGSNTTVIDPMSGGYVEDNYIFANAIIYTAGGGSSQSLTPGLLTQSKTIFAPTALPGATSVLPSLYSQTKTFFSPTVSTGALSVQPSLFSLSKTFFSPTVVRKSITSIGSSGVVRPGQTSVAIASENMGTLTSVAVNGVAVTSLSATGGSGTFTMPALTDGQISGLFGTEKSAAATNGTDVVTQYIVDYQPPSGFSFTTLSGSINQTETGVGYGFSPALAVNDQILFDPTKGYVDEQGNHYSDTPETQLMWHIEYATGIARSFNYTAESVAQTLSPSLITRSKTFHAATITTGAVSLLPTPLTVGKTVFSPTVTLGAVAITPPLLTQSKIFYGGSVSANTQFLSAPIVTQSKSLFAPSIALGPIVLSPGLLSQSKSILPPAVSGGAVVAFPPLLTVDKVIFDAEVLPGAASIESPLITNSATIFSPSLASGNTVLSPPLLTMQKRFYRPVVWMNDYLTKQHPRKIKPSYGSRVVKIKR